MPNLLIDHLVFRARLEPDGVAVQTLDEQITHAQLLRYVQAVAGRLRREGVQPGQFAATSMRSKGLDWILTLALFHEGLINCSASDNLKPPPSVHCDWLLADTDPPWAPPGRTLRIDGDWIRDAQAARQPITPRSYESLDSIVRLFLTSGTTGASKAVPMTQTQIVGRAKGVHTVRTPAKSLSMFGSSTAADFNASIVCLLNGAPVYVAAPGRRTIEVIKRFGVEAIFGSPLQVAGLIRDLDAAGERLPSLRMVRMGGATPSAAQVAAIQAKLAREIFVHYGSTEAAGMCCLRPVAGTDPAVAGIPYADVQVEVVDESGNPLAVGEEGAIRVKSQYMADGYYGDAEQSAKSFRGGWFYPGDRGCIDPSGALVLSGRDGDVINIGGWKIDPVAIERFMVEQPGVRDAAVFGATDEAGTPRLAAAVVAGEGFDFEPLKQAIRARFGESMSPKIVYSVGEIPRNQMGKVVRPRLATDLSGKNAQ